MDQPLTIDEAVDRFDVIADQIKRLSEEKRALADFIAVHAMSIPRTSNTIRVTSRLGVKLKIELRSKSEWDTDQLMTAATLMSREQFDSLFKSKIEFTAQKRALNEFLGTVTSDEAVETAKQIIRDAKIEMQSPPTVSVEKSNVQPGSEENVEATGV